MPVANLHAAGLPLPQLVFQAGRNDLEFLVVISRAARNQHFQPVLHREAGRDHQNVFGKAFVLWIGNFVQHLPCDQHGHQDGLARAGGHFRAQARELTAIAGDFDSDAI